MIVSELIKQLQAIPDQSVPVILQKDGEGNGYSPLSCVDGSCLYDAESTWSGEAYHPEDPDEDVPSTAKPAVILAPVN